MQTASTAPAASVTTWIVMVLLARRCGGRRAEAARFDRLL